MWGGWVWKGGRGSEGREGERREGMMMGTEGNRIRKPRKSAYEKQRERRTFADQGDAAL